METLREMLLAGRIEEVEKMAIKDKRRIRELARALYDDNELAVHRAADVWGRLAVSAPSSIARHMSRLAWQLNDESGGIGKGSPLVIAEVARANPPLAKEVVLVSTHYLDDRGMLKRVLWGIGRVGEIYPALVEDILPQLRALLSDAEADVRGMAVWALGKMKAASRGEIVPLLSDGRELTVYENGGLNRRTVRELAQGALDALPDNGTGARPAAGRA